MKVHITVIPVWRFSVWLSTKSVIRDKCCSNCTGESCKSFLPDKYYYRSLGWSNHRRWREICNVRQVGTPPGGDREVCMTHRGAHATGGLATWSHYYALWLLGNKVNAGRHGFRCLTLALLSLISALLASLTGCHNQRALTHTARNPAHFLLEVSLLWASTWACRWDSPWDKQGWILCLLSFVKRHFSKCLLPFYGLS